MSGFGRWLCNRGKHNWSSWWITDSTVGYEIKPVVVKVQTRQCIRKDCLYTEVQQLMAIQKY